MGTNVKQREEEWKEELKRREEKVKEENEGKFGSLL